MGMVFAKCKSANIIDISVKTAIFEVRVLKNNSDMPDSQYMKENSTVTHNCHDNIKISLGK